MSFYHRLTHNDLAFWTSQAESMLRNHVLYVPEGIVALLFENSPALVVGWYAIIRSGGVVTPCNPHYTVSELAYQLTHGPCTHVVVGNDSLCANVEDTVPCLCFGARNCWLQEMPHTAFAPLCRLDDAWTDFHASREAALLYTSGTTGRPKGVVLTVDNLRTHAQNAQEVLHLATNDVVLVGGLPLFHIYAIAVVTTALEAGCDAVLLPRFDSAAFARTVAETHATTAHLVPPMVHMLLEDSTALASLRDTASLRRLYTAAAPLAHATQDRLTQSLGGTTDILQIFGMSELAGILTATTTPLPGSIGRPASEVTVLLIPDEACSEVVSATEGELCLRTRQALSRYLHNPDATAATFFGITTPERIFRTGDLARRDATGSLYIVGRLKTQVKVMGYAVSLEEVEATLVASSPGVRDVCVVPVEDNLSGEALVAAIDASSEEWDALVRTIQTTVSARLAEYKRPATYVRVAKVIRSGAGKIQRATMRDMVHKQVNEPEQQDVLDASDLLGRHLKDVPDDAPLLEHLSSLQAVQLARSLAASHSNLQSLASTAVLQYPTRRALRAHLTELLHPQRPSSAIILKEADASSPRRSIVAQVLFFPGNAERPSKGLAGALHTGTSFAQPVLRFVDDEVGWMHPDAALLSALDVFDATTFAISEAEARAMDPQQRLLLEGAAAVGADARRSTRDGVCIGISATDWFQRTLRGPSTAFTATSGTPSVASGRLSFVFDLTGPCVSVDTACSAALVSLQHATAGDWETDRGFAGAVNLMLEPAFSKALLHAGMLSSKGRCFTFDSRADGYARAEGCWMAQLAPSSSTRSLTAWVVQDGRTASLTAPSGEAQRRLLLRDRRPGPVLEAHGTGTTLGDAVEAAALGSSLDPSRLWIVGGVKANVGHAEAAAGAYGLVKLHVQFLRTAVAPNAQLRVANPHVVSHASFLLPCQTVSDVDATSATDLRGGAVSSFGYSGTIAHVFVPGAPHLGKNITERRVGVIRKSLALTSDPRWQTDAPTHRELARCAAAARRRLAKLGTRVTLVTDSVYELVVVGGGLAGLTNASIAGESSTRVLVLEASDSLGGTWVQYGNATSRVNSSEPSYRLAGDTQPRRNHSHFHEILQATADIAKRCGADLRLGHRVHAVTADGWVRGSAASVPFSVRGSFVIVCTNRRLGRPRQIALSGEPSFGGEVYTGVSDSTARTRYTNKHVVVYGMGAFAIENVRTALEGGAEHVSVVARQLGTVCPQILDYLNFAQTLRPDYTRDKRLSARMMVEWRRLHDATGTPIPDAWSTGMLKPDGHTVSVSDAWFLACYHKRLSVHVGSIHSLSPGCVHLGDPTDNSLDTLNGVDILIKCVGFEQTRTSSLLPSSRMHGLGMMSPSLAVFVEPHLDENFFHSPFGSSYLLAAEVHARAFDYLRRHPGMAERLLAHDATELVDLDHITATQQYDGLRHAATLFPELETMIEVHTRRTTTRCLDFMQVKEYLAYNRSLWNRWNRLLARDSGIAPFPYPFDGLVDALSQESEMDSAVASIAAPQQQARTTLTLDNIRHIASTMVDNGGELLTADEPLMDAGLDSLAAVEFRTQLEMAAGVPLSPTVLFDAPTLRSLQTLLEPESSVPSPASLSSSPSPSAVSLHLRHAGVRLPAGLETTEAFWASASGADDLMGPAAWDLRRFPDLRQDETPCCQHGGFVSRVFEFDPEAFQLRDSEARSMDPQQRILLELSAPAVKHMVPDADTAVVIGAGYADFAMANCLGMLTRDVYTGAGGYLGIASGRLSFTYDLRGPCVNVDTSCSSGLVAVQQATHFLLDRTSNLAWAGACFLTLLPWGHAQLARAGMLSPTGRCHTFDRTADGFAKGEGIGLTVLAGSDVAASDTASVAIATTAVRQDGRSASLTAPNGDAQTALLREVLDPTQGSLHEAHGTGTALGDPVEVHALSRSTSHPLWGSSWKANAGHAEPCAGLSGFVVAALACMHRVARPNAQLRCLNPHLANVEQVTLPTQAATVPFATCNVASFGFNGTIAAARIASATCGSLSLHQTNVTWRRRPFPLFVSVEWARRTTPTYHLVWNDAEGAYNQERCTGGRCIFPPSQHGVSGSARQAWEICCALRDESPTTLLVTRPTSAPGAWGIARTLRLEQPTRSIHCLHMVDHDTAAIPASFPVNDEARLLPNTRLQVPRLEVIAPLHEQHRTSACDHLLVGGTGGVGLAIARWLERTSSSLQRIRLVSRTVHGVDASCVDDVRHLCAQVLAEGRSWCIWHLAGSLRDKLAPKLVCGDFEAVFASKVVPVHSFLTTTEPLAWSHLASSSISVFGSVGQCNYAAANDCLEAFVGTYRTGQGRAYRIIQWGVWSVGVAADRAGHATSWGLGRITPATACRALDEVLWRSIVPMILHCPGVDGQDLRAAPRLFARYLDDDRDSTSRESSASSSVHPTDDQESVLRHLLDGFGFDPDVPLSNSGLDSLGTIELSTRLQALGLPLAEPDTSLTVRQILNHVVKVPVMESSQQEATTSMWHRLVVPRRNDAFATLGADLVDLATHASAAGAAAKIRQTITCRSGVCGHPGVVHGGIVALLLDDAMGVACSVASCSELPNTDTELQRTGVTASMSIQYKRPCPVDHPLEIEAHLEKVEGRKRFMRSVLRVQDDATQVLAEGESLYILPK